MSKLIGLAFATVLLLPSTNTARERFTKYKAIEAYETRPGILMMPRYADDGQVCEIGLQKRLYFPEKVSVINDMSRDEIEQTFEELVPASERGSKSAGFQAHQVFQDGSVVTNIFNYENVSLEIDGQRLPSKRHEVVEEIVVAIIHWKNRKCH